MYTSDSLEVILNHLSTRVMNVLVDGRCLQPLDFLVGFLAAWEKRPTWFTPMIYQWCSVISEVTQSLEPITIPGSFPLWLFHPFRVFEEEFSRVGPACDLLRRAGTSCPPSGDLQPLSHMEHVDLLFATLKAGFRLVGADYNLSSLHLEHTPYHNHIFETAFSSYDDETIADAVAVWVTDTLRPPPGSLAQYFSKRVEWHIPFSSRLRWACVRAIECVLHRELDVSGPETIRLMNRLKVNQGDIVDIDTWIGLLLSAVGSPAGVGNLSSHYWCLLDELVSDAVYS